MKQDNFPLFVFFFEGFVTERIIPPAVANGFQRERVVSLSDTRNTVLQGQVFNESSDVSDVVRRLNNERIQVDQELRDEEQVEIRSLLSKEVRY